ncbi:MAG TPA: insulinase family protein [Gammaproteobacteria bacterium]|nr:insulinase family protein [Gammaproteobacteria bacterium]
MNAHGFELLERRRIATLNLEFQAFRHVATGARHYHLACDDDNNAFMVAFPTLPQDSTGVAHILEHTTLCGSARYPVRDPFFMMLRRSLNTFMNAFTSSDSTAYPFATRNRKDFDNLLAVYLDAVFFPKLDARDFAQEGCRVEFVDPAHPAQGLVYKGVVYNEMKGAMSSPVAQLWHHLQADLFPQTPYRYNSGGDPAEIPTLTHAALREFHARHYHPTQAVFLTYGCFDPLEHQAKFATLALDRFEPMSETIVSGLQPPLPAPRSRVVHYAVDDAEDEEQGTHIVWGWLLGETGDPRAMLEAHVLSSILLEHSACPLRHFLETTELARAPSELCGIDDSARQFAFYCGVEGSDKIHAQALEQGVFAVLERVAREGVDPAVVEAALDRIEMAQRDVGGDGYPYGLQLMSRVLPGAMYRRDPAALLDIDALLAELRERAAAPGYPRELLERSLLKNGHRVQLVMVPDRGKREAERRAEQLKLAALHKTLVEADAARIREATSALEAHQARQDDPEILPRITLADVPAGEAPIRGEAAASGDWRTHNYSRGTNGIVTAHAAFELPALDAEEIATLSLFAGWLTDFGAGRESYLDTQARRARLGQFGAHASIRSSLDSLAHCRGHLVVTAKGLKRKAGALVAALTEALPAVRLDERQRLRELLTQARADLELSITDRGHHLAMHGAMRGLSPAGWLADEWDGPAHVLAMQALDDAVAESEDAADALLARFAALHAKLAGAPVEVLLVGEDDALAAARARLAALPRPALPAPAALLTGLPPAPDARGGAWFANADVNFCAKAYAAVPQGAPDAPALAVLARFLSDGFLHPAVRERGGAYGGGASYDSDGGAFAFYSYRDPRLIDTLADFDRALEWLASPAAAANDKLLEEAILGVIRGLDKPRSPAGAAVHWFYSELHGRSAAFRAEFRRQVLATTLADLRTVAARHLDPARGVVGVVTHAGERSTIERMGLPQFAF